MENTQNLILVANKLRKELLIKHSVSKMSHIGSDFSALDIMISLYIDDILNANDHFILSKGHAALGLYAVLHEKEIISDELYSTLGKDGSVLGEHPIYGIEGIEVSTGSLGHGLSIAVGMALAKNRNNEQGHIYVLLSDGECQEGSTLEAMNFGARFKLNNITAIVDSNRWQAFDRTILPVEKIKEEFLTAGWETVTINGHDYKELHDALSKKAEVPLLILANTILGKGVKSMEDKLEWHYKSPSEKEVKHFVEEIL